jgi:hypothetical protein
MNKILHVVKEPSGRFQIRRIPSAGEGPGSGDHRECENEQELQSGLRAEGCTDECITVALKQLEQADNAEIRL